MANKRRKNLKFQMENNELQIQIATMLNLVREDAALNGWNKKHDRIIEGIIEDLKFVYDNYVTYFQLKKPKSLNKYSFNDNIGISEKA